VRPDPPISSVSPVSTAPSTRKHTESGVCPGVCITDIVAPPSAISSPSTTCRSTSGLGLASCITSGAPSMSRAARPSIR
jgi:hypothetical protein